MNGPHSANDCNTRRHDDTLLTGSDASVGMMLKTAVQQGRSQWRPEAYPCGTLRACTQRERRWRVFSASCYTIVSAPLLIVTAGPTSVTIAPLPFWM